MTLNKTIAQIKLGTPAVVLAPMEGITDAPMRAFLTEVGSYDYCVSEFLRVSSHALPARVIRRHMPEITHTQSGCPVQLQLLGGNAELLAETAATAVTVGVQSIDLNFGCPAPTVNNHDGGASLLRDPPRLRKIIETVRKAVPLGVPVSAKLRLGWQDVNEIDVTSEMAAQGGASWITIHGRTRMQGYKPPAWHHKIGETRARLIGLPIIANGEIWTREDFLRARDTTHCEHFMLGRGALADPSLSTWVREQLGLESSAPSRTEYTREYWYTWLNRFAEIANHETGNETAAASRMKAWIKFARMKNKIPWFDEIKTLKTTSEILSQLKNHTSCSDQLHH